MQEGWIDIKEIYPPNGRYIFWEHRYNWIGIGSVREGKLDYNHATHWMYLPEPPIINKKDK